MAFEHLFSQVPVLMENVYRIPTEPDNPMVAAKQYEDTLRKTFHIKENAFPRFDLLYLGLGRDAHVASLMPMHKINVEPHQLVASVWVPEQNMARITLTPHAINHANQVNFLVTGANKALAVKQVLEGPRDPVKFPGQLITHNVTWYLDALAASELT